MPEHPYLQWPVFRRSVVAGFQRSLTDKAPPVRLQDLTRLVQQHGQLESLYYEIEDVISRQNDYIFSAKYPLVEVQKLQDEVRRGVRELEERAKQCSQSPADACPVKPGETSQDYRYRKTLPAPKNSVAALREIETLPPQIEKLQGTIAYLEDHQRRAGRARTRSAVADLPKMRQELEALRKRLTDAQADYPKAIISAAMSRWIEYASDQRCKVSLAHEGCLSNEEKNRLREEIRTAYQ
jgi:hypothetical protein